MSITTVLNNTVGLEEAKRVKGGVSAELSAKSQLIAEKRAEVEAEVSKMQYMYHQFYMDALKEYHLNNEVCHKDNPTVTGRFRIDCTMDDSGVPLIRVMYKADYAMTSYPAISANPIIWKNPANVIKELVENYIPARFQ